MLCAVMQIKPGPEASYRYGVALLFSLVAVVFFIVAPDHPSSRAIGLLITGGLVLVVIVTGQGAIGLRRVMAAVAGVAAIVVGALVIGGAVASWIATALGAVLIGAALVMLVQGLARLVGQRGVTLQAVSGALAVYLLVGLLFALVIGVVARVGNGPYFSQGTDASESQHVYFSFTTMTTTGYGDLTPGTSLGRALSVVEMLIGQIYLVTVIGLLVGNLRRARTTGAAD
jgi:ion channel